MIVRGSDRWDPRILEWHGHRRGPLTIHVIDSPPPAEGTEQPEPRQRVPFGFGVREPCPARTVVEGVRMVCRLTAGHQGGHEPRPAEGDEGWVDVPLTWEGDGA